MIQPLHEIEKHYSNPDPWGYQTNPHDIYRKGQILEACKSAVPYGWKQFSSALDIGAGEGWITQDLPAIEKYGYEISEQARSRFPNNVMFCANPTGSYELVTACGVLYPHYNVEHMFQMMKLATKFVVTCNIEAWEVSEMRDPVFIEKLGLVSILDQRFDYREYVQKLRVFKVKKK